MILEILCYRNKGIGAYTQPWHSQSSLDNEVEGLTRSLFMSSEARTKLKKMVLYHLGTFDDKTGKYDLLSEPELLLDCDDVIAQVPEEK